MRSEARAERVQRHFEVPVLVAALATVPALVLINSDSDAARAAGTALNWIAWGTFLAEALMMLWVVPRPVRWAREHPLRLLIVLGSFPLFPAPLAWLRLFRLFRLLELTGALPEVRGTLRGDGVRYPALLALFVIVCGGLGLTVVEGEQDLSAEDGIWWSVETVTTVGYGDIVPETDAGRVLGALVMLTGVGIVGYVLASGAERLTRGSAPTAARRGAEPPEPEPELQRRLDEIARGVDALGERLRSIEDRLDDRRPPPP